MNKIKRLILILSISLLFGSLCACSGSADSPTAPDASTTTSVSPSPSQEPSAQPSTESRPATDAPSSAEPSAEPEIAYTVGGRDVTLDEYYYLCLSSLLNICYYYDDIGWETTVEGLPLLDYIERDAMEMSKLYAALETLAKTHGIRLDEETAQALQTLHQDGEASIGGAQAYNDYLQSQGLTREVYEYACYISALYNAVYGGLYGENGALRPTEPEILDYAEQNEYITVLQILLLTLDLDTGAQLDAEGEKEALAASVMERVEAGEDFLILAEAFSEDYTVEAITFGRGEMVEEFELAAYGLEPGQVSEPVRTAYGWHIIKRLDTDPEAVWDEYYSFELFDGLAYALMDQMQAERAATVSQADLKNYLSRYAQLP